MIAIVGGGCSGVLVAAHLIGQRGDADVMIFEPRAELGRGIAYATPWREHLLNVPAGQMSAFASRPAHFVDWLECRGWPRGSDEAFAPRYLYGDYLQDVLRRAIAGAGGRSRVTHVRAEVVDLGGSASGLTLTMSDGSVRRAASAVLALGNASPAAVAGLPSGVGDGFVFGSAWETEALRLRSVDERILLIGSGLTAIDAVLAFEAQGHVGPVHLVSRRGRLPQAHRHERSVMRSPAVAPPTALRRACRVTRQQIQSVGDWRRVIDGLRPVTNDLWRAWSPDDRARFLRHLKVYWDAHRHRMAPEISAALAKCQASGRFHMHAGRVCGLSPSSSGPQVAVASRGGPTFVLTVDRVINCTGIEERYDSSRRPLIRALLSKGLARPNALGTGFAADSDGALVDHAGRASPCLFTLGPPRYGDLLETIAVPDICLQAERLAGRLARPTGSSRPSSPDAATG